MERIITDMGYYILRLSSEESVALGYDNVCSWCHEPIKGDIYYNCVLDIIMDSNCSDLWNNSRSPLSDGLDKSVMMSNYRSAVDKLRRLGFPFTSVSKDSVFTVSTEFIPSKSSGSSESPWGLLDVTGICFTRKGSMLDSMLDFKIFGKVLSHRGDDMYVYIVGVSSDQKYEMYQHFMFQYFPFSMYKIISEDTFEEQRANILDDMHKTAVKYDLRVSSEGSQLPF